jgi:hypothetical protein
MLLADSNVLPDNAGYVVAAYLVFLALILIYVVIMAVKMARISRDVAELDELTREPPAARHDVPEPSERTVA